MFQKPKLVRVPLALMLALILVAGTVVIAQPPSAPTPGAPGDPAAAGAPGAAPGATPAAAGAASKDPTRAELATELPADLFTSRVGKEGKWFDKMLANLVEAHKSAEALQAQGFATSPPVGNSILAQSCQRRGEAIALASVILKLTKDDKDSKLKPALTRYIIENKERIRLTMLWMGWQQKAASITQVSVTQTADKEDEQKAKETIQTFFW